MAVKRRKHTVKALIEPLSTEFTLHANYLYMQETQLPLFIDPFTDFGAKKLFGPGSSRESLIDFLNAILKLPKPIVEIEFISNEQLGALKGDRKSVFDIHCRDEEGNYIITEIQRVKQDFFKDRSIFYSTYPIRAQGNKGQWNYKLNRIYTICILDFCFDDTHPDQVIHRVKLIDEDTHALFCDRLMYWYIEVPKFHKTDAELVTREDKWLYALKNMITFTDIPLILADDPIFKSFFMDAKTANLMEQELQAYYAEMKLQWDKYAEIETAKNDGETKGKIKGKIEGKIEGIELATQERNTAVVKNLLQHTSHSVEEIAKLVDVPVEFVLQIQKDK